MCLGALVAVLVSLYPLGVRENLLLGLYVGLINVSIIIIYKTTTIAVFDNFNNVPYYKL